MITEDGAAAENDECANASDEEEVGELPEAEGSDSDEGGETTDEEVDGDPFECPPQWMVMDFELSEGWDEEEWRDGVTIAHRWDVGWYIGEVKRKATLSANPQQNGKYACKYPDSRKEFFHDLYDEDYGENKMWVILEPDLSDI